MWASPVTPPRLPWRLSERCLHLQQPVLPRLCLLQSRVSARFLLPPLLEQPRHPPPQSQALAPCLRPQRWARRLRSRLRSLASGLSRPRRSPEPRRPRLRRLQASGVFPRRRHEGLRPRCLLRSLELERFPRPPSPVQRWHLLPRWPGQDRFLLRPLRVRPRLHQRQSRASAACLRPRRSHRLPLRRRPWLVLGRSRHPRQPARPRLRLLRLQ